jgi:nucleotide-binding universal stress UspA family protein
MIVTSCSLPIAVIQPLAILIRRAEARWAWLWETCYGQQKARSRKMKVVLAIDDSPYSDHVVDAVCHRHWPADTEFKIVSVIEPMELHNSIENEFASEMTKITDKRRRYFQQMDEAARERILEEVPGSIVHFDIRNGNVRDEIISAALEWDADRILVGARGRDICPNRVLGSVSSAVASHAPCSVEIVRPLNKPEFKKLVQATNAMSKR